MTDNNEEFRFVSLLALELDNGDISLPSLPDVVMRIRELLADENADFGRLSSAISMDPVLVSRLFVVANSAYYNRANVKIDTLDTAIGRLGIEVVRNTAMSLAMKQLYSSNKHDYAGQFLRAVWARGMKLSCMAFAVATRNPGLNEETAFLCGLLNEIGKLYIITKAEEFPSLLGNKKSFDAVLEKWNSQITKSIVESWGFPEEIAHSADAETYQNTDPESTPDYVDVVAVARWLVDHGQEESLDFSEDPSCVKLGISEKCIAEVMSTYRDKLKTMQQSLN